MGEYEVLPPEGEEDDYFIKQDRQRRIAESDDRMTVESIGRFRCKHPMELVFEDPLEEVRRDGLGRKMTYHRVGVCQLTLAPGIHIRIMYERDKRSTLLMLEDELNALWLKHVVRQSYDSPMRSALLSCFTDRYKEEEE